jgi:hypothetical protein
MLETPVYVAVLDNIMLSSENLTTADNQQERLILMLEKDHTTENTSGKNLGVKQGRNGRTIWLIDRNPPWLPPDVVRVTTDRNSNVLRVKKVKNYRRNS